MAPLENAAFRQVLEVAYVHHIKIRKKGLRYIQLRLLTEGWYNPGLVRFVDDEDRYIMNIVFHYSDGISMLSTSTRACS